LSSELDALRGIGVGYGRLLRVPYAYAIPLAFLNLAIVGYLQPYTEYKYESLRFDLNSGALGAAIKVGEFNRLGKRLTLRIESSQKKGTELHGIFVETEDGKGTTVAATAESGRFFSTDNPDEISFHLMKGRLVQQSPKFKVPRTLAFETYTLPVSLPAIEQFRRRGGSESDELYLHELWRLGYGGGAIDHRQKLEAQARFNFRLVEVLMMLTLPLLAVSLAVPPKRSSSGLGIFIAILIVVAYHKINQYGQQAGSNGQFNPILALWVPLLLFASMILWMYHVLAHHPGGQPIGALERFFAKAARLARSLLPKSKTAQTEA
jgi:lipopolysaccharide export system permease protein